MWPGALSTLSGKQGEEEGNERKGDTKELGGIIEQEKAHEDHQRERNSKYEPPACFSGTALEESAESYTQTCQHLEADNHKSGRRDAQLKLAYHGDLYV